LAATPFIVHIVAGRQAFQMRDQFLSPGDTVRANLVGHAGPEYLLGSSGADLEKGLESLAVYPRPRLIAELGDDLV